MTNESEKKSCGCTTKSGCPCGELCPCAGECKCVGCRGKRNA